MSQKPRGEPEEEKIFCLSRPEPIERYDPVDGILKSRFVTMSKYSSSVDVRLQMKKSAIKPSRALIEYVTRQQLNNSEGMRFRHNRHQPISKTVESDTSSQESEDFNAPPPVQIEVSDYDSTDSFILDTLLNPHIPFQAEYFPLDEELKKSQHSITQNKIGFLCPFCKDPVDQLPPLIKVRHYIDHIKGTEEGCEENK